MRILVDKEEKHSETAAGKDCESRRESVHPVDHVDGIHYADHRDDRQDDSRHQADAVYPDYALEVAHQGPGAIDDQQAHAYLQDKPEKGRNVKDIVDGADVEHYHHCADRREQVHVIDRGLEETEPDDDAEEDRDSANHGNGILLQLALIRIVDELLRLGNFQDGLEYQESRDHGDREQYEYYCPWTGNDHFSFLLDEMTMTAPARMPSRKNPATIVRVASKPIRHKKNRL